eukprot:2094300-Pyramimonas_sp.AAC.1
MNNFSETGFVVSCFFGMLQTSVAHETTKRVFGSDLFSPITALYLAVAMLVETVRNAAQLAPNPNDACFLSKQPTKSPILLSVRPVSCEFHCKLAFGPCSLISNKRDFMCVLCCHDPVDCRLAALTPDTCTIRGANERSQTTNTRFYPHKRTAG